VIELKKKSLYEGFKVNEYWIVDPEAVTIEEFGSSPSGYRSIQKISADEIAESKLLAGFRMQVSA